MASGTSFSRGAVRLAKYGLGIAILAAILFLLLGDGPELWPWHKLELEEEFAAGLDVESFDDYLALEQRLFRELDKKVYDRAPAGSDQVLNRYSPGSLSDPRGRKTDWNRSFEFEGSGKAGVLLLHGMSDSPYSLRALGEALHEAGHHVIGLRLPGHGTTPSGLLRVDWRDMAAAAEIAADYLASFAGPIHIIGYSTGGSLALNYTLDRMEQGGRVPASLVLVSPAIQVHPAAALARFKAGLSALPGLGGMAWMPARSEFDPFKYNSFPTNAGSQVHGVTVHVDRRIQALTQDPAALESFPPVLVVKSAVDTTVTTEAVVDRLLERIVNPANEMLLFDINRQAAVLSSLLVRDPAPLSDRLMADPGLPFELTLVGNASPDSAEVVAHHKTAGSAEVERIENLGVEWPYGVISLSHVAVPFPPDDPLYGRIRPEDRPGEIFLGDMALRSEHGLLKLPADWLLRMRYNPFYDYMEERVLGWMSEHAPDR